jgi:hypothetical protein
MKKIGFLINPIAGMGGAVGLKGTDGNVEEARRRGAVPLAINRAKITLHALKNNHELVFLTPSGVMGEDVLREIGVKVVKVVTMLINLHCARHENAVPVSAEGVDRFLWRGRIQRRLHITGRNVPVRHPGPRQDVFAAFAIDPGDCRETWQD